MEGMNSSNSRRVVAVALAAVVLVACEASTGSKDAGFPDEGNVLIADQFNNRVIEVTAQGSIVWSFGDGNAMPGPTSVAAPNDAERLPGGKTLISGTGAPQNAEPACSGASGCVDNRVFIVDDATGAITWQYGQAGVTGSGANQLNAPVAATMLASGNVLITDQGNQRVIEVTPGGSIAWQYGTTGTTGAEASQLNNPNSAERLSNGNTLIADEANNRVIEVTASGSVAWQYPSTMNTSELNAAAFASRLSNGNTLIADSGNNRVIEVTEQGTVAWSYVTSMRQGSNASPQPTRGVRLANGDTLIADQFNHQVIEVNTSGMIVWSYGQLNVAGADAGQLNAPYDAKSIGDFTGLTSPF